MRTRPAVRSVLLRIGIAAGVSGFAVTGCAAPAPGGAVANGPVEPSLPVTPPVASSTTAFQTARVLAPSGASFDVEVVQDPASRERGLQDRAYLGRGEGMLFVHPAPGPHRFWMFRCLIPLDIVWLDAERRVVHIEENLPPCSGLPCPDYGPERDAQFVLEVGAGLARSAGFSPGARVTILFSQPPTPT